MIQLINQTISHPTVVIVTTAHQNPCHAPLGNGPGNCEFLFVSYRIKQVKLDQGIIIIVKLSSIFNILDSRLS